MYKCSNSCLWCSCWWNLDFSFKSYGKESLNKYCMNVDDERIMRSWRRCLLYQSLEEARSPPPTSIYTISSKFSSFIEFLRGGIQLLSLFDLICIFIIFQYVFGLDEFSKRILSKLFTSGAVTAYSCGTPVYTPGF